ncbi:HAD-IA family hydrolase [Chondrinema litorale]|uniref:HAD-IA family hydrolase n=1 Tax=Chondrinema litorale TaxID=2994555 RepID=UPI002543BBC8|nr:HAD-IA family hydrolase [Chondrinema litorale]UZR93556.1 HAD-IA family hydrolase [Chondrinema litorale]
MDIQLVVFDMAGTTVKDRNNVCIAIMEALADEGIFVEIPVINKVLGYPKPLAIRMLMGMKLPNEKDITDKYVDEIHQNFVKKMIHHYESSPFVAEKSGVRETLAALKSCGIKIGIDTGFNREIADTIFARLNWVKDGIFDYSITSDEVKNGRPHPDMILNLMEQAGVTDPKQVIKVGDAVSDIQEGRAAGCGMVVAVTTGSWKKEDLEKEEPDYLIYSLPELLDIIGIHQPQ